MGNFVEMLRYKVYSKGGTLSFERPVMLFVHGLGGGYANWVCQVRNLKKQYDLIVIELPSHGRSPLKLSETEPNIDEVSARIIDVLDHLGVQKVTFVGVSLGSMIVQHLAYTYPERTDKYILIAPIGRLNKVYRFGIRLIKNLLPIAPMGMVITLVCALIMPYKSMSYARNMFMTCARRVERKEFIAWCKVLLSLKEMHSRYADVMKDEPNGLYIAGELDYLFLPMIKGDMKRISNFVTVKKAGHICNIDQYQIVNDLIIAFQDTGSCSLKQTV